ncbi:hypothetical protein PTKU46_78310 [Paraburkholderia terrae]
MITYEMVRCWCDKFGAGFAWCAKSVRRKPLSTWYLDEILMTPRGEPYLLWCAVDEHGAELDVLIQEPGFLKVIREETYAMHHPISVCMTVSRTRTPSEVVTETSNDIGRKICRCDSVLVSPVQQMFSGSEMAARGDSRIADLPQPQSKSLK